MASGANPKGKPPIDWRERVLAEAVTEKTEVDVPGVQIPVHWRELIRQAAKKRGMSAGSYVRRAVMAFTILDLGLDYDKIMVDEPGILPADRTGRKSKRYRGREFGDWRLG